MPLTELECLTALRREGDFDRAAAACGLSVGDLRAALQDAERVFDAGLLQPGERFAGFTAEGERILDWATRSLDACTLLKAKVQTMQADGAVASLLARRSVSPKRLVGPGPGHADLQRMLQSALRAPDHGGLHPWRVLEFGAGQREALATLFEQEKLRRDPLAPPEDRARAREHATRAPVLLAFVVSPRLRAKVPVREQWLSAGAALGNLLNAAHRLGYGAIVLSGERCFDAPLAAELGLAPEEFLAGFVSVGHVAKAPPMASPVSTKAVWSAWRPAVRQTQAAADPLRPA